MKATVAVIILFFFFMKTSHSCEYITPYYVFYEDSVMAKNNLKDCEEKVLQHDAHAQYVFGKVAYDINNAGSRNQTLYSQGNDWFMKSANQGFSKAQYELGIASLEGLGTDRNIYKAIEWFEKSASKENKKAQYQLGLIYYEGKALKKDYNQSLKWFKLAAANEHVEAQAYLADMYFIHEEIQDYYESFKWSVLLADKGFGRNQHLLAVMYNKGLGVRQDKKKAKFWFGKLCDNGDQDSCDNYRILNEGGY